MVKDMDTLVSLCKQRGYIFPGSEPYGGLANSWDYGPLGVLLKQNIKQAWWRFFVQEREDMVGLDAALLMNSKVWEASGHVANFSDPLVEDKVTHERYRADHLLEETGVSVVGMSLAQMADLIEKKGIKSPKGNALTTPRAFNMMFKTHLGPVEDEAAVVYFRPETAQAMFVDFKSVVESSRVRVPFGIAQIGKAFRNEITPGNYIFRTREFEQMEIEYFIKEGEWEQWFEHWLKAMKEWMAFLGLKESSLHYLEVEAADRAHYSKRTVDIEYRFPFGTKELYGLAYRTDFDLSNHMRASGQDLRYLDPITNEKYLPHVIEPTFGVDRTILALLCEHYHEEEVSSQEGKSETRTVLRLPHALAPIKVAVLPLSKKPELEGVAKDLASRLRKHYMVQYDETQSIGRRYRRQDEIGTPLCITVDFDSLTDDCVTVRARDTMKQERIAISELLSYLQAHLSL